LNVNVVLGECHYCGLVFFELKRFVISGFDVGVTGLVFRFRCSWYL